MTLKFIIDENLPNSIKILLQNLGHDAVSIRDINRGTKDENIVKQSYKEKRIILTRDKDFGELIYLHNLFPFSVILLKLALPTKELLEKAINDVLKIIDDQNLDLKKKIIVFDGIMLRIRTF